MKTLAGLILVEVSSVWQKLAVAVFSKPLTT